MIFIGSNDKFIESFYVIESFLKAIVGPMIEGFFILQKRKDGANDQTLLDLDYDNDDIKREILGLQTVDYVYSVPDAKKPEEDPYKVFHKIIKNREIYIKIKIKHLKNKTVYCMSFHEARYPETDFPHRGG